MITIVLVALWLSLYVLFREMRRRGLWDEDLERDVISLGAIALLAAGFFWRPLLTGEVWMPADGGDLGSFLYPTYRYASEWIRQGIIPLWNPHLYSGLTFVGDIQSGILYPVYWIVYLLSSELTYAMLQGVVVLHIALAGATMYLFLRFFRRREADGGRLRRLACMAGAVAFMFSDLFIVHFGNVNMVAVMAWLPLAILFFHRALADRRPWLAVWCGVTVAVATLAGHIQMSLFLALVLAARTVWDAGSALSAKNEGLWPAGRPFVYLALAGLVSLGLSAPVLLPFLQHAGFTERVTWTYSQTVQYSLAPGQFVSLLVPTFFGRGPAFHWGLWDRVEVGYIGVFTLILAGAGVALRRRKESRFFLFLAGAAFLVALGLYAMPHGWLYQLLPGFDQLRAPARFVVVMNFALAVLAALGLDAILRPLTRSARTAWQRYWRWVTHLALPAAALLWGIVYLALLLSQDKDPAIFLRLSVSANGVGLLVLFVLASLGILAARRYGRIRPRTMGVLAIGLIFFDLSSTGSYIDLGTQDPTTRFEQSPIVSFLKSDDSIFRIDTDTGIDRLWQPNTALIHGLFDIRGIVNPLEMQDKRRYLAGLGSRSTPLYDALNVRYLIGPKEVVLDWERFELAFDGDAELNVYRNRDAMPRAWVVGQVRPAADHEDAWQQIHAPDFNPRTEVVLEGGAAMTGAGETRAEVRQIGISPNRISLDVYSESAGVLVLSEVYYPGWHARVNGKAAPVLRANYLFRGVELPAGVSQVVLFYSPVSWWIGLGGCALPLVGVTAAAIWFKRRRR